MSKSITIKSSVRDYKVHFIQNRFKSIRDQFSGGDIILLDSHFGTSLNLPTSNRVIQINATEQNKEFNEVGHFIENILAIGVKRSSKLIVIGGGITQDIAGFAASILFRGIEWLFYPTTLLSQCDSCIGGKTSINFRGTKNLVGSFYPPSNIYIDTTFLSTLSDVELRSGIGEMCHYFLVHHPRTFEIFHHHYLKALNRDEDTLELLISHSLTIKQEFIQKDEFDTGERLILNYGHTFGHAIESITNFSIPHGVAVCHGMNIANYLSFRLGYLPSTEYSEICSILSSISGNMVLPSIDIQQFKSSLENDKKNTDDMLTCILTRGIGDMFIHKLMMDETLYNYLEDYFVQAK